MNFTIEQIAEVCHEANRVLQRHLGEEMNLPWHETHPALQSSAIDGVFNKIANDATPRESHENWLKFKQDEGWTYGPEKDFEKKTHPCFVAYDDLPKEQQYKDALFISIVEALT